MAKVLGIGGILFKSPDPKALLSWYQRVLGMPEGGYVAFEPSSMPASASTVFGPFKADTEYFAPSTREFMFNLIVDDLDGALTQLKAANATLVGDVEDTDFGRFARFMDPDGNKVELWQPK